MILEGDELADWIRGVWKRRSHWSFLCSSDAAADHVAKIVIALGPALKPDHYCVGQMPFVMPNGILGMIRGIFFEKRRVPLNRITAAIAMATRGLEMPTVQNDIVVVSANEMEQETILRFMQMLESGRLSFTRNPLRN